jgi:hypothetical protein
MLGFLWDEIADLLGASKMARVVWSCDEAFIDGASTWQIELPGKASIPMRPFREL